MSSNSESLTGSMDWSKFQERRTLYLVQFLPKQVVLIRGRFIKPVSSARVSYHEWGQSQKYFELHHENIL